MDAAIRHAETYHLLSVTEQGDVPASQAGLRELEHAEEMLKQGTLPPAEVERFRRHVEALKSDLQDQIEVTRRTLEGVFPLTGFLTSSLFADSGPAAIYRLIDDPAIKATRKAAADLVARETELEKKQGQLPVVVTCVPPREPWPGPVPPAEGSDRDRLRARTLEHAARQVFRGSPQFQVHAHAAVEEALAPAGTETVSQARDDFRAGHITTAVEEKLLQALGPRLLVVVIRQADAVADVSCYRMEGRLLEAHKPRQEAMSTFGFGRDRRDRLAWILGANAALLAIAYAAFALVVRTPPRHGRRQLVDHASPRAAGGFRRGAHPALRNFPAAGVHTASPGNAGAGLLLDRVPGRPGLSRRTAAGLLAGVALVRRVVAEFEPGESRRRPVDRDGSGYRGLPGRPHAAVLGSTPCASTSC